MKTRLRTWTAWLGVTLLLGVSRQPAAAAGPDASLGALSEQIRKDISAQKTPRVAVLPFLDLNGKASDFGNYLSEELTAQLFRRGGFQLVERARMRQVVEEQKLGASGLADEATAAKLGQLLGADLIITGTYLDLETSFKVYARTIATGNGAVLSVATVAPPMDPGTRAMLGRPAAGTGADRFDGVWEVVLECANTDAALGYTFRFPARVQGGILHGQYGEEGHAPCVTFDGRIGADGRTLLMATGLTGNPLYNPYRNRKGTPYSYHVEATFTEAQGTGRRVELRPCTVTFNKR